MASTETEREKSQVREARVSFGAQVLQRNHLFVDAFYVYLKGDFTEVLLLSILPSPGWNWVEEMKSVGKMGRRQSVSRPRPPAAAARPVPGPYIATDRASSKSRVGPEVAGGFPP